MIQNINFELMKNLKTILLLFLAIPSIGISQHVFSSNQELKDAVDMYVNYPSIGLDTYGEINTWDVSAITDMSELFKDHNTFNEQISNWNTSNVINMRYMFSGATSFNQNIGSWDTSNVVYMSGMFKDAHSFNQDIGNWNTSNVFDMNEMFYYATSFNQDIGYWDTSIVRDMDSMFFYAESFDQDIGSWDISAVTEMSNMFYYAKSFDQDISNWDFNITSSDFFTGFLSYSGLSTTNYNEVIKKITLKYINGTFTHQALVFGAENLKYCNPDYRQYMIDNFGWQFNDGGQLTAEISLISPFETSIQNICENNEIEQIIYEFGGAANSGIAYGLPTGINWEITGNTITISGTASEEISETTIYDYTIQTIENNCSSDPALINGSITINPDAEITLSTPSSTSNQFICEGESIDPITYSFGGGTVDFVVSGLPPGISAYYNPTSRIMTITGTPTQNIEFDTTYNYNVIALNDQGCESSQLTGNIIVKANAELTLLSSTLSTNQTVCVNSNIADIRIQFKNSSVPSINNLPSGLISEVIDTDVLRIFGSVSVGGPYNFEVIGANPNGCSSTAISVQLSIVPNYSISPTKVVLDINDPANGTDESLVKNISCYGKRDGEIMVNISNSSSGLSYIYSWSGPSNYVNTTQSNHIKNLSPGTYNLSVYTQGQQDCAITQSFSVTEPGPLDIVVNTLSTGSCSEYDDGLISVSVGGGDSSYFENYFWESLVSDQGCTKYTVRLRDADIDGIFDIVDADIDNDGNTDPGKIDSNNDGYIDFYDDYGYSYGIVSYQTCEGIFVINNILADDFSQNGIYEICAVPNTVTSDANLDHDLDDSTTLISSVSISGGTVSCSSGSWQGVDRLNGTTYADNLLEGLYRFTVVQGPEEILDGGLDSFRNDPEVCFSEEIFELPNDQILINSLEADYNFCSLSDGTIDIELNHANSEVYFYYDGVRVPNTDVEVIETINGENNICNLYTARLRDADIDGIFDIEDADIDNNGATDPGKTDVNGDGMIDEANDPNFSFGTVSYQSCDGFFTTTNILRDEFSPNGIYQFCAVANSVSSLANLNHDLDDTTNNISSLSISEGYSCGVASFSNSNSTTTYRINILSPTTNGSLEIRNSNNCSIIVDQNLIEASCSTASTKDYSDAITIYPNPTTSIINIEKDFTSAKVYDISGRELLKSTSKTIDLSELPSSIYLLRLYDKSNKVLGISKVVKQ